MKLKSVNPATLEVLAEIDTTPVEEVFEISKKAQEVFRKWSATTIDERLKLLKDARDILYREKDEIAKLITLENGKPILESYSMEIFPTLDLFEFHIKNARKILKPRKVRSQIPLFWLKRNYIHFEPLGVVAVISPWNYPLLLPIAPIISALVAGNCVIFKPSEYTSLIGLKIYEIFKEAGFPDGVFNIVVGFGDVGEALVNSHIDKISFTGSTKTGRIIMQNAGKKPIPVTLELGGKDPMIVFDDVDIDLVSSSAVWGAFANAGQTCVSVEVCYVQEKIFDDFVEKVVEKTKNLKIGNGLDPDVEIGPINNERQLMIIEKQIEDAISKGAKILTGGKRIYPKDKNGNELKGYFFEPTVITDVDNSMLLMREETFGPVLPIVKFKDEDEVIEMANSSEYGLSASVWTKDKKRAKRIVEKIKSGSVLVNECVVHYGDAKAPCGGVKSSGFGRVHSEFGIYDMVNVKFESFDFVSPYRLWWFGYDEELLVTIKDAISFLYSPSLFQRLKSSLFLVPNLFRKEESKI
jgi:succinate-semialdehyde dehydrogenase/glutarate-semialdehyde dehydrogenase